MLNRVKVALIGFILVLISAFTVTPAQAAPYCGITWGSTAEVQADRGPVTDSITNIRAGRHDCYDRMVVDIQNARNYGGYDVRYVPQVTQDGSGFPVPLRGAADIQVILYANNHDLNYNITYNPRNHNEAVNVSGYTTFRQVAWAGSFEGQSTIGLGVRARLPMRAFVLTGPGDSARLVVDVAHKW